MATLGGKDARDAFKKMFEYIFPNIVLAMFSWKGTVDKKAFKSFENIKRTFFDAVKCHHKDVTMAAYDKFTKDWVRHAKFRKV